MGIGYLEHPVIIMVLFMVHCNSIITIISQEYNDKWRLQPSEVSNHYYITKQTITALPN